MSAPDSTNPPVAKTEMSTIIGKCTVSFTLFFYLLKEKTFIHKKATYDKKMDTSQISKMNIDSVFPKALFSASSCYTIQFFFSKNDFINF